MPIHGSTGADGVVPWQPTTGHRWDAVLRGLHADALDCLQSSLAVLADHHHGPDAHLGLGLDWRLPDAQACAAGHLQVSLLDRLAQATRIGLRSSAPHDAADLSALQHELDTGTALYLVADAFDLPWVPYVEHRHMPHSFLAVADGDAVLVVDAYHNETAWGPARPGAWLLDRTTLDRVLGNGAVAVTVTPSRAPRLPARAKVLTANARRAMTATAAIDGYVAALHRQAAEPDAGEQLLLDVWLLGRERALHAAWLAASDDGAGTEPTIGAAPAARAHLHATRWRELATRSYVAVRRARGGPVGPDLVDAIGAQLRSDAALAVELGGSEPARPAAGQPRVDGDRVTSAVIDALATDLDLDETTIRRAGPLRTLPGFDSFRLVHVIDRIERRLGVSLPAGFSGDDLRDVDGLCRLFTAASACSGTQQ